MYFKQIGSFIIFLIGCLSFAACAGDNGENFLKSSTFHQMNNNNSQAEHNNDSIKIATFGAGCFWCTEAQFQQLDGVMRVESGYTGGHVANPTYKQVCTGTTGHAEVTNVYYDPKKISFDELLAAFWTSHDPTQLNRQGNDVGTQYRSAIFYHDETQKQKAEVYKQKLNDEGAFNADVVTEIVPATTFYKAENYHQDYYNLNGSQPYCQFVVRPKLEKFKKVFAGKLK